MMDWYFDLFILQNKYTTKYIQKYDKYIIKQCDNYQFI